MKAGAEVHFLAGQIFTLAIAAMTILPRMPTDYNNCSIGGNISYPFRRSLLVLIIIGLVRVVACHLLFHPESSIVIVIDTILGTIHVIGQSFLCLTTAYLLRCQLSEYINIDGIGRRQRTPGQSLLPALIGVSLLTISGTILSTMIHSNFWCLVNLAEAYSCLPVLKTLKLYGTVTTIGGRQHQRGPIFVQILMIIEYWYLITSLLSFMAEAVSNDNDNDESMIDTTDYHRPVKMFLDAVRHNQDNGIDDWTRLMLHSVFLNSIDELQHFGSSSSSSSSPPPSSSSPPYDMNNQGDGNDTTRHHPLELTSLTKYHNQTHQV